MNRESHAHDLDWTAFRYIADELSAEEAAAFEILLADRQDARDAVARAVQLTGAIAAATPASSHATVGPGVKPPRDSSSRQLAIAAAAMACLILVSVLALRVLRPAPNPETNIVDSHHVNDSVADANTSWAGNVVSLWASADSAIDSPNFVEEESGDEHDGESAELQLAQTERGRALTVPDWLVIAVSNDSDELSNPGNPEEKNSL